MPRWTQNCGVRRLPLDFRDQYFGCEIELTGINRATAAQTLADLFGTRAEHSGGGYDAYRVKDLDGKEWKIVRDGSIHPECRRRSVLIGETYKVELNSPKLEYGEMEKLQEVVRSLRRAGGIVNDSCGMHVHVDASKHTPQSLKGVPFVEAVQLLCEESPTYIPVQHEAVERERPLFRLPNPAPNNDRVTRYLLGRGVSLSAIRYCIERKILYESAEYHNCVFLGKDSQGVPKYAALRGIYDYGKPFKREAPGSQKQYGFCIPPMQPGTTVAVFEAAIDAMAEMTLCGDVADKYRLSLGGVSSSGKEPLALQKFLRQHPEITTIELRLDNDAKGRMASVGIRKIYADRYTVHDLPPNIENGDYADMAKNNLMVRTAAHRAAPCR